MLSDLSGCQRDTDTIVHVASHIPSTLIILGAQLKALHKPLNTIVL